MIFFIIQEFFWNLMIVIWLTYESYFTDFLTRNLVRYSWSNITVGARGASGTPVFLEKVTKFTQNFANFHEL